MAPPPREKSFLFTARAFMASFSRIFEDFGVILFALAIVPLGYFVFAGLQVADVNVFGVLGVLGALVALGGSLLIYLGGLFTISAQRNREFDYFSRRERDLLKVLYDQDIVVGTVEAKSVKETEPPRKLVEAIASGRCVLFAGAGISVESGYADNREIWARILASFERDLSSDESTVLFKFMRDIQSGPTLDILVGRFGRERVIDELRKELVRSRQDNFGKLPRLLGSLPFSSAITTNYDDVLSRAFESRRPATINLRQSPTEVLSALRERDFLVFHIFGTIDDADGLIITNDDYRHAFFESTTARALVTMLSVNSVFFVGTTIHELDRFLSGLPPTSFSREHYALVPDSAAIPLLGERFLQKYKIHLIGYPFDASGSGAVDFVQSLREKIREEVFSKEVLDAPPTRLQKLRLRNIGHFKRLEMDFSGDWTLMLGDNGVGKSTILRAIAVALGGANDRVGYAAPSLLSANSNEGSIEIELAGVSYRVDLLREGGAVACTRFR